MGIRNRPFSRLPSDLSFILLAAFLGILWLAGGASRADALGQVLVRATAWTAFVLVLLFGKRSTFASALANARPVLLLLAAAAALALIQLIPLPPALWQALPGRAFFAGAAEIIGQPQPWRPWSVVPGATVNALSSLIVPMMVLILVAGLKEEDRKWLPGLVLGLVVASMLLGLLQVSGAVFDNPLINDSIGEVSGTFANRNHFALFLAMGCLIAPVWAFMDGRRRGARGAIALGLVLLFALTILATGSRAGLVVGMVGIGLAMAMIWRPLAGLLRRYPRWVFFALVAAVIGLIGIFILISISADRAASIDRAFAADVGQDMRSHAMPTVFAAIQAYFPMGSGLGGFDQAFRIHEPFTFLNLKYFNHAHNEFLEIALDAGIPGIALLLAGLSWWGWASVRAWRSGTDMIHALPKLGSAIILLIIIASIVDYPARTPMIMAMAVIAGIWLHGGTRKSAGPALPKAP